MHSQERWITKFKMKSGSWIFIPNESSRESGKNIKYRLEKSWKKPSYYFHLRIGGHVEAIRKHADNHSFLHLDIKNFFGNINKSRVTRNLKPFFGYKEARTIAEDSTVRLPEASNRTFILPFGFIQSPVIASLCLYNSKLGKYLDTLKKNEICVSVYMDDIIISNNNPNTLEKALKDIRNISSLSQFPLNDEKTEGPAKKITAFKIELSHLKLKINDIRMKEFKAAYLAGNDFQKEGILSYIKSVNIRQAHDFVKNMGRKVSLP